MAKRLLAMLILSIFVAFMAGVLASYAPAPVETTHAQQVGLEWDWDNNCIDNDEGTPLATGTSTSGGVPECNWWWTWTYDNCFGQEGTCDEEVELSPENHHAWVDFDEAPVRGAPCTTFTGDYQVDADIWFCPYVPTTEQSPTSTPFTGAKVGEVTLKNGNDSATAGLYMVDT